MGTVNKREREVDGWTSRDADGKKERVCGCCCCYSRRFVSCWIECDARTSHFSGPASKQVNRPTNDDVEPYIYLAAGCLLDDQVLSRFQ